MVGVVRVKVKIMRAEFRSKGDCWCCGWIFKDKVSGTYGSGLCYRVGVEAVLFYLCS